MKRIKSVRIREEGNGGGRYPIIRLAGKWMNELGYLTGGSANIFVGHGNRMVLEPCQETDEFANRTYVQLLLERFPGSGEKAMPISTPQGAYELVRHLEMSDRERFTGMYLNAKNHLNCLEEISVGTLTASLVHPREVFKTALLTNSASVILAHNHPSGDPTPSREDIELTERLVAAGSMIGVDLLDHIIVGHRRYESLKESGYFQL